MSSSTSTAFASFRLSAEVEKVRTADHGSAGKATLPVMSLPGLRVVLVSMRAGASWKEHSTPGRITVHPIVGDIRMRVAGEEISLTSDNLAAFAAGVPHDVLAVTDAVFVLTVARPNLD